MRAASPDPPRVPVIVDIVRTPAQTVSRLCASSLQALRAAAHAVMVGEGDNFVVAGIESVSRVGRGHHLAAQGGAIAACGS